jgi:AcrR family transcriptional regulator
MPTQAERSAATCDRLLDATIRCLAERGYGATSLPEICRRAGASRGAQLHHYATKELLVAAALERLFQRRLDEIEAKLAHALRGGALDLSKIAGVLWSVYTSDTFYAWLELVVASRTSPTLRRMVAEVDARFVDRAERLCKVVLLPEGADPADVAALTRLILAIFDGLATHRILTEDDVLPRRALRAAAKAGLFTPGAARA